MKAEDEIYERLALSQLDDDGAPSGSGGLVGPVDGPVRLSLSTLLFRGAVDGAWWPYSRDVATQLPALVGALPADAGRIAGIALNLDCWKDLPLHVQLPGRQLRLGWYRGLDPNTVALTDTAGNRLLLLVIPPDTAPGMAARVFARSVVPDAWTAPGEVLEEAGSASGATFGGS